MKQKEQQATLQELSLQEMQEAIGGGLSIFKVKGLMDGEKGNTEVFIFGVRVYHGKNA